MANKIGNIVFYAEDPVALSEFWAAAFGYEVRRFEGELRDVLLASGLTDDDLATRGLAEDPSGVGPRLFFHHADGPKAGRNRLHLDVNVQVEGETTLADLDAERDRLVSLGASVVRLIEQKWGPWPELYYQMRDPEGNEFCLQ
ncbi:VOC family protein [Demequina aurantiaca]|uniref:VOC family protein n=1 Tax=Demequina aurantiaca TaxID=676200 RepID=UPI0007820FC5|nr:VOC family protein [Demequina aurantiaca]